MISWTELKQSIQKVLQFFPEVSGELVVSVTNHFMKNTKKPTYLVKEEVGTVWGTKYTPPYETKGQVNVFSKIINAHEYNISIS